MNPRLTAHRPRSRRPLRSLLVLGALSGFSSSSPAQDPPQDGTSEKPAAPSETRDRSPELEAAIAQYEAGEQDAAAESFTELSSDPQNLLEIARYLCFEKHDFERGEAYARRCPEERSEANAWHPLMTVLLLTGESKALEELSREQRPRFPDDDGIYFYLGLSCTRQNKTLESIDIFEDLVKRSGDNLAYRYALGDACLKGRQEAKAEQHYRKALQLQPDHPDAVWRLGDTLSILGKDTEAEKTYKDGIQRNNMEACYRYGVFLFQRDRFQEAMYYFKRWTTEVPERAMPWSYLGRCHLQLGRKRSADKALARFRELRLKNDSEENDELSRMLRTRRQEAARTRDG